MMTENRTHLCYACLASLVLGSIGICVSTLSNEGQPYCLIPLSFCLPSLCFHPIRQRAKFGEVFDQYERKVLKARNEAIEAATEKYLSELAPKKPV